jgi:hypothetical protein
MEGFRPAYSLKVVIPQAAGKIKQMRPPALQCGRKCSAPTYLGKRIGRSFPLPLGTRRRFMPRHSSLRVITANADIAAESRAARENQRSPATRRFASVFSKWAGSGDGCGFVTNPTKMRVAPTDAPTISAASFLRDVSVPAALARSGKRWGRAKSTSLRWRLSASRV